MSRFQVVPFAISLVLIFPWKSTQVKIHSKMASACLVFSAKNPVKSDKVALIEGKVLNEMILDIYIPVVPIDNWLGATHNQRQKTLEVASVLLFRHILKTKSWPECIYTICFTHIVCQTPGPQIARARRGGQSGKVTAVVNQINYTDRWELQKKNKQTNKQTNKTSKSYKNSLAETY